MSFTLRVEFKKSAVREIGMSWTDLDVHSYGEAMFELKEFGHWEHLTPASRKMIEESAAKEEAQRKTTAEEPGPRPAGRKVCIPRSK